MSVILTLASTENPLFSQASMSVAAAASRRHVTEPEAEQKTLLQRLGLILPRRLKRLDSPEQM
jgi:hypothetical protein